jgi:lipopolysaccharide transport system ATP-binding protein
MTQPIISVQGLSKQYVLPEQQSHSLGQQLKRGLKKIIQRSKAPHSAHLADDAKQFWALKDVSFEVYPGERIGILGKNGAGKSTLLKILSRLVYPTQGEAVIRGRVTSLLEVGTGFNANLSGRENIYLNASLHGLNRAEVDLIFKDIVEFSGVGTFLETPIKHYSSGMRMRLAFSVAAHLDPDILMLDEVLAVGDLAFQQKCLRRVEDLTSQGRTILFVSHNLGHIVQFCNRVIWLDQGQIRFDGETTTGITQYQEAQLPPQDNFSDLSQRTDRTGTGIVQFTQVSILDAQLNPCASATTGQAIAIELKYRYQQPLLTPATDVFACIVVENENQQRLFGLPSEVLPIDLSQIPTEASLICRVSRLPLVPGIYTLSIALLIDRQLVDKVNHACNLLVIEGDFYGTGKLPLTSYGPICVEFDWHYQS